MYFVYVLLDKRNNFYIGFSKDLKKRIIDHKKGKVFATKSKLPLALIYYESCINKFDATKREKYLKSGPGRKYLKYRIKNYLKDFK